MTSDDTHLGQGAIRLNDPANKWCAWCIAWTTHPTEACPVLEADRRKMRAEPDKAVERGEEPDL